MFIDLLVIAALLVSALIAFLRGFIREVLTIFGVVGGFFASVYAGPPLSGAIKGWIGVEEDSEDKLFAIIPYDIVAEIIAYGSIFILVVILLSVASHFIAKAANTIGLGPIDRTLGVVFGIVRAVILLGLLYMPVHLLVSDETKENWFKGSRTIFHIEWTAEALASFLPEDFDAKDAGEKAAENTRERLKELDLLSEEEKTDEPAGTDEPEKTEDKTDSGAVGYEKDQRQKLDELFEDKTLNR